MGIVRYGTCSWSEKSWVGPFYPKGTKPGDFLDFYATQFDTVEVDATYYRRLGFDLAQRWVDHTPPGFLMATKFPCQFMLGTDDPREAVNEKVLEPIFNQGETLAHMAALGILGARRGPVVVQLPYFKKTVFPDLAAFLSKLEPFLASFSKSERIVVEVRNPEYLHEELLAVLRAHRAAFCLNNIRGMPHPADVAEKLNVLTTDFFYARLIGDRSAVDRLTKTFDKIVIDQAPRLQRWAALVQTLATDADGFVYANNHFAGHGPETARRLKQLLSTPA